MVYLSGAGLPMFPGKKGRETDVVVVVLVAICILFVLCACSLCLFHLSVPLLTLAESTRFSVDRAPCQMEGRQGV